MTYAESKFYLYSTYKAWFLKKYIE
ncbi:uncharacterized protein METZ01_LOCUS32846 [marine metagenome]|uniref:Uncharacterized protein n=1 Tax=marine metagenome TaxID=408172 RepID=A0A381QKX2_9ZZZZ